MPRQSKDNALLRKVLEALGSGDEADVNLELTSFLACCLCCLWQLTCLQHAKQPGRSKVKVGMILLCFVLLTLPVV